MLLNPHRFGLAASDPYWSNVTSLLHFNGADGSTSIVDQRGLTWTQSAEPVVLDTSVQKFGASSAKALAVPAQRLFLPTNAALGFGTGDYTIEMFFRANTLSSSSYAVVMQLNNGTTNIAIYLNAKNSFICRITGATDIVKSGISLDTWYHLALCREAGIARFFVDGTIVGSPTAQTENFGSTHPVYLFASAAGGNLVKGHMDEFRVTKGVARYNANFTPPTAPFPDA